jgi:hypothetical protein
MTGTPKQTSLSPPGIPPLATDPGARGLAGKWLAAGTSKALEWPAVATLAVLVLLLALGSRMLADPDTHWHIASGRLVIENRALLWMDHFSFTFAQHPWISKEWLSQVLFAAAHLAGSWHGVALLTALAIAITFWLIVSHVAERAGLDGGLAMGALFVCLSASTFLARPHALVFAVIAGWVIAHIRSAESGRRPPWLALPLLALWANMHGAFIVGLIIAGAFGLEAVVNARPNERIAVIGRWLAFGAACLVAVIANPYGYGPLLLSLEVASHNEGLQYIGEWLGVALTPKWLLLLLVAAAALLVLAREPRQNAGRIMLVAFLTYMMCKHERFAMFFAITVPLVAGPRLVREVREICRKLDLFQGGIASPGAVTRHAVAGGFALTALALLALSRPMPPPAVAPIAALSAVPAELRERRVFNSYDIGGFLTLNGVKTFIDGRTDQLFLDGFMVRMMEATFARDPNPLAALLDEYRIEWAIIGALKPEARLFPRIDGWRLHYQDAAAQVWVRRR